MMTTKQRIRKIAAARQAELEAAETVEREMTSLKPGDEVWLDTGFFPVFDAYLISNSVFMLKVTLPDGRIQSDRIRFTTGNTMFTCRV